MADLIVIGAGHAGCEAALAAARMGVDTLLLTLDMNSVALMPCNPAIGGTGKGHLVRELDALGGQMGLCIDRTFLQSRMLNRGKGPAVHSLRAQADKRRYHEDMMATLFSTDHLTIRQGEAMELLTQNGAISGVRTMTGEEIPCRAVVICSGVYLKSRIIIGQYSKNSGPQGLLRAEGLSQSLTDLGFELRRFKTGTPARVDVRSIDFDKMEPQPGDDPITPFSFLTVAEQPDIGVKYPLENRAMCYLTYTNKETHRIIRENLHLSPMVRGEIKGTGARYCPSIEDKIRRFADKDPAPALSGAGRPVQPGMVRAGHVLQPAGLCAMADVPHYPRPGTGGAGAAGLCHRIRLHRFPGAEPDAGQPPDSRPVFCRTDQRHLGL